MNPISKRYQKLVLENTISKGAFAEVYKGRIFDHSGNEYRVAVKILKKRWIDKPDLINRLEDEADLLAQLNHTNIISALGYTDISERPSIIMEYIDGIDLKTLLKHVQLPPNLCFLIGARVAAALHSAFSHKLSEHAEPLAVIHRDIKPSNVMLTRNQGIKVLDFGASRFNHKERKGQTTVFTFGSPKYMSNERKKGDRGSHSSDIYSLGIMLLELLSGRVLTQNPPNNQQKHDRFIEYIVQKISFQLPSPEWNTRAQELLIRMCAFWKNHRFTAAECFQLLSAFAQHAKGSEQEDFWNKNIIPILDQYQTGEEAGPLTGQIIMLTPSLEKNEQKTDFTPQTISSKPKIISPENYLRTTHPPNDPSVEVFLQKEKTPEKSLTPTNGPQRAPRPVVDNPTNSTSEQQRVVQKDVSPAPIEHVPIHEEPLIQKTETKPIVSETRKNLVLLGISTTLTFCFLHFITFSGLALSKQLDVLFPAKPVVESAPTQVDEDFRLYEVILDIDLHHFISLSIKDEHEQELSVVNKRKEKSSINIPSGTYTLTARERTSKEYRSTSYQFSADSEIHCGAPDGEIPKCIDHNENTIISFSDAEE